MVIQTEAQQAPQRTLTTCSFLHSVCIPVPTLLQDSGPPEGEKKVSYVVTPFQFANCPHAAKSHTVLKEQ
jgi:hypothetical protein